LLEAKIIAPTRNLTLLSDLVVVRKKIGDIRLCVDFKNLNVFFEKDNYPLPNMEHLLQRIIGLTMKSFLDGFSGYNQVWLNEDDRHRTTFTTPWGTFEYLRMLFVLINAGVTFQKSMDYAFRYLMGKIIEIYQDDVRIFRHLGVS
jgi:hypothetical protein